MKIRLIIFSVFVLFTLVTDFTWLPNGAFLGKEIAVISCASLLVIPHIFSKPSNIKITVLDIVLGLFYIYALAVLITKPQHGDILRYLVLILCFGLYYVLGSDYFKPKSQLKYLVYIFLFVFSYELIVGLEHYLNNFNDTPFNRRVFNLKGQFANPAPYACFLSFGFLLGLGILLFYNLGKLKKYVLVLFLVLSLATIILSESRTAIVALILTSIFICYKKFIHQFKSKKIKRVAIIAVLGFTIGIGGVIYNFNTNSMSGRFLIWKISLRIIRDNVLTGIGLGNYQPIYMTYQSKYFSSVSNNSREALLADNVNFAFNEFIQLGAETGLFGLVLIAIVLVILFQVLLKKSGRQVIIITALLIHFLIISQFSYPLNEIPLLVILCTILFLIRNYLKTLFTLHLNHVYKVVVLIAIIVFNSFWVINTYNAYSSWNLAKKESFGGSLKTCIKYFETANKNLSNNGFFLFNYGAILSEEEKCTRAIPILLKASKYYNENYIWEKLGDCSKNSNVSEAEFYYINAINMVPNRFTPMYKLFLLYKDNGKIDEAKKVATDIIDKKIKIPSQEINDMKLECSRFLSSRQTLHKIFKE
ncbi:O-antigen ligase family protein [Flavobacteriaceae bacterium MHTCC 0001]